MLDLLDASVWLPLSVPDHVHHRRARRYWDEQRAGQAAFCRMTKLALLRHLTDKRILGDRALRGVAAWKTLDEWIVMPGVIFLPEPSGVDELLRQWVGEIDLRSGRWTDAYLAAFAASGDCRLVAFDADFERFPGLDFLLLSI